MAEPIATYRVQFRDGMSFDKAAEIVPYLRRLGISHLYASPIFTAVTGSTHGYDVTDHNQIDPAIGGREGFERLHKALKAEGMGLILDIVPNHMAASLENRWWRSVVEHGASSPFASFFDIDWSERLTLPILGREYTEVLSAGELRLQADAAAGCLALAYFDNLLPLQPSTYRMIAQRLGGEDLVALVGVGDAAASDEEAFHELVRGFVEGDRAVRLATQLDELSKDLTFLDRLHEAQPWRLTFWKEARRHLSYRRFFEVTGLAGLRVEESAVFDAVHRLSLELVRSGKVDGLRIDHVDGLAFPTRYLRRLRQQVGPDTLIFVEKILGEGEQLPAEWPISGSTGYEFISAVADLLVDQAGAREMEEEYSRFTGHETDVAEDLRDAKLLILRRNFEGELRTLASLGRELAGMLDAADVRLQSIEDAIAEIIVAFRVYRTYGEGEELGETDRHVLSAAVEAALADGRADAASIRFTARLLRGELEGLAAEGSDLVVRFRTKFQQLTGPVMAKAVEDTLFYRRNALIALNEVGGSPGVEKGDLERFHRVMQQNADRLPGLLATATHDTKRGEDTRARLYTLAEQPRVWGAAVSRWSTMNAHRRLSLAGGTAPDPEVEWLLYQALAGVWPVGLDPSDARGLGQLADRFLPYVQKALREAKLRSDWLEIHEEYESAVQGYAGGLLDPANSIFLEDFVATLQPFIRGGAINSISQTLAKLTTPGIPDFYQGSEGWDFSLVDPDNRRAIDYSRLGNQVSPRSGRTRPDVALLDGSFKLDLMEKCLACRREMPDLFATGSYTPLTLSGARSEHFAAYLRQHDGHAALVVLQRLPALARSTSGEAGATSETSIELPGFGEGVTFRSVLTGEELTVAARMPLESVLQGLPVALALGPPPRP